MIAQLRALKDLTEGSKAVLPFVVLVVYGFQWDAGSVITAYGRY